LAEQIESMGAEFVFLAFKAARDGAASSSPEFRDTQLRE
jgi:hypothetical protein